MSKENFADFRDKIQLGLTIEQNFTQKLKWSHAENKLASWKSFSQGGGAQPR